MRDRQASNRHARTRRDHATETAEDYVEAIGEYLESKGQCRVTDLAAHFAVSHVTVNRTIARLQRDGLVDNQPYGPVELTAEGRRLADESRRRHDAVFQFLVALGVSPATAAADSEGIEHHVSDETLRAMRRFTQDQQEAREKEPD
ncbi:MAG: manganese-binding transcriptional regulator MntR [Pirellulaceae bacterium]|nr:manganese-binding transcriptional regulator MntR [Pirellulaceae bacterium]